MKGATKDNLNTSRAFFRRCANKLERRNRGRAALSATNREMQIGFGLCADWQRWAATLNMLSFAARSEHNSSRKQGLTESTRFNYIWTGTNALFSRKPILALARQPSPLPQLKSELQRFRVLYDFAQLPADLVAREHKLLNQVLSIECQAKPIAGAPRKSSYTMLEIIFYKYIVPDQRDKGVGLTIGSAITSTPAATLEIPTIIYAARNWSVHGVLLSSSFRGSRQKYVTFIESLMFVLSEVLARAAINFDARL